jgi:hypothetical protein
LRCYPAFRLRAHALASGLSGRQSAGRFDPAGIDNRASVEGTLGRPTFVSQFGPQDWYYVSRDMRQLAFANPKAKEQTVLRVRFDAAGNVERLDKAGIDKVTDISPKDGKTPTLGRERTFFEDIFGNIGAVARVAPVRALAAVPGAAAPNGS